MYRLLRPWLLVLLCIDPAAASPRLREITLLGSDGDSRVAAVHAAVAYWNLALTDAGVNERLVVTRTQPNLLPLEYFHAIARGEQRHRAPPQTATIPGDLVIALVDAEFISYAVRMTDGRRFVALRQLTSRALASPGVANNLAAHEIGHSLGLHHNADPATLMCGAPANCRPTRFATAQGLIFPLQASDRAQLARRAAWLAQYPGRTGTRALFPAHQRGSDQHGDSVE